MDDLSAWPQSDNRVEFCLWRAPVSFQARSQVKDELAQVVGKALSPTRYLISGDVRLTVEWWVSEKERYESDRAPDIDNILKPLIDCLVGPEAILIDDNQVKEVSCLWRESHGELQRVDVLLQFEPKAWVPKERLVFVQFQNGLCLPVPHSPSKEETLHRFHHYARMLALRGLVDEAGADYSNAKVLMPEQRVFHRSRLKGFRVVLANAFVAAVGEGA
jgi:Holliday junction resolvase RusA-like endonuclease